MDAPVTAGYQLDPSQWDQKVTEAIKYFGELIIRESSNCSQDIRQGRKLSEAVQVPWEDINGELHLITIRPKYLAESYSYIDLSERIANLESWRLAAYFYMIESFSLRLLKIESISSVLKAVEPLFKDNPTAGSLQSSPLLRSMIVRFAKNELAPPTKGEHSPRFQKLCDSQIVKVLRLLTKIFCEEAKELKQLKDFTAGDVPQVFKGFLAQERSIKVAEDYPFRPLFVVKKHGIPDIAEKIKQLNPFRSILFSYILQKSSQIIYEDTFLSFFCRTPELVNCTLLQSCVYKVMAGEAENYLAIPAHSYTRMNVPRPEPVDLLQAKVEKLTSRFSETRHAAKATLYVPESLFYVSPEELIAEMKEQPFKITLIRDDDWEYFLDKIRYKKTVKSFVPAQPIAAPVVDTPKHEPVTPPETPVRTTNIKKAKKACLLM